MKVVQIEGGFGLEHVHVAERPEPEPGPGQVKLRVTAASLNYRDLLVAKGIYNPKQPLPLVPCSDGVGEVIAIGPGVTRVRVGQRVAGIFAQGWLDGRPGRSTLHATTLGGPLDGMLAEQVVLSAEGVVSVPEHLSDVEAAALPCAGVTAWSALVRHGRVRPGERVLVMGTGGVAIFALQIAKLLGAEVIVTSSSDDKLARARELGADHGINYRSNPKWFKEVAALTDGSGVEHIIEIGGVGTLQQSLRCVAPGGNIYLIGVLAGPEAPLNLTSLLMQDVRLQGVIVGPRVSFEELSRAVAQHQLRPVVDRVFPLAESRQALEYMANAKHLGKICIQVASE
jgi:NADPH:quinone reductase-like Zn-dependent oxidoreductase